MRLPRIVYGVRPQRRLLTCVVIQLLVEINVRPFHHHPLLHDLNATRLGRITVGVTATLVKMVTNVLLAIVFHRGQPKDVNAYFKRLAKSTTVDKNVKRKWGPKEAKYYDSQYY